VCACVRACARSFFFCCVLAENRKTRHECQARDTHADLQRQRKSTTARANALMCRLLVAGAQTQRPCASERWFRIRVKWCRAACAHARGAAAALGRVRVPIKSMFSASAMPATSSTVTSSERARQWRREVQTPGTRKRSDACLRVHSPAADAALSAAGTCCGVRAQQGHACQGRPEGSPGAGRHGEWVPGEWRSRS